MKIAITCHYAKLPEDHPVWRRAVDTAEVALSKNAQLTADELIDFIQGADALITGTDWMREEVIARVPDCLKVISRPAVGYDRVDIQAARRRGIHVCNAPGTNTDAVADLTMGLLLSCARRIPDYVIGTRELKWQLCGKQMNLFGKTLGILGLGAIGRAVAIRAKAFGMKILACDPFLNEVFCREQGVEAAEMDDVIKRSDVITLHLPLLEETRHVIDKEKIRMMKDQVILLNAARGGLVDHDDLCEALQEGKIRAYGADVMEEEPPGDHPLFHLPGVYITPHAGANTLEASENMMAVALTNALDLLEGKSCKNIVNL
ncbi:MAG: phosphoglycerate dehydrogenase [Lachnospiraceae bacterium]|nr:phosphoglycerate dehydrogenase [Lachnospiraceae bacterium]